MDKLKTFFNKERLILVVIVFLFYGNTLKNGYSLDDNIVTEKTNITAKGIQAIPKIIKSYYLERAEEMKFDYRPLVKVCFAIEHELFGVNTKVSHFINILLYLVGLFLVYDLLQLLFSNYKKELAFYCVVLFAIMPIHTEVVASLKNRDILLCFVFCIIGFKQFILFFNSNFKKWVRLIIALICFYAAFLSKFDALPFIAIIPVLLYVKHQNNLKWLLLFCFVLILSYFLFKLTRKGLLEKDVTKRFYNYFENPLFYEKGFSYKLIALFNCLGFYINQAVFPFKQCCYYGVDTIPVLKLSVHGYLGIIATPLLIFGLIKSYLKKDYILFAGLFIFCASISMYLNVLRPAVGIVADRFTFFASLGVAISIVALLIKKYPLQMPLSKSTLIFSMIIITVFGSVTVARNTNWNSLNSLITADYNKYTNNSFLNYKQGVNLIREMQEPNATFSPEQRSNRVREAKDLLEKSVRISPDYAQSRTYLAYVLIYLINDFKAAIPEVNLALQSKESTELYFYKGICMRETKQNDSAEFYLKKCLERDNTYFNAYNLLMFDYNAANEFQKSIDMYNTAIKNGVETVEIYNGLGKTYWQMKNNVEAKKYYQKALDINPANEEASAMVKRL